MLHVCSQGLHPRCRWCRNSDKECQMQWSSIDVLYLPGALPSPPTINTSAVLLEVSQAELKYVQRINPLHQSMSKF